MAQGHGQSQERGNGRTAAKSGPAREVHHLHIGQRLRWLRRSKGYILKTVARGTGLSPALLSLIENEQVVPPIPTLLKISRFFGVPLVGFFEEQASGALAVVRARDRRPVNRRLSRDGHPVGYQYFSLGHLKTRKIMDPYFVEFEPKEKEEVSFFDHEGEEFIFVLNGRLEFSTPDQTVVLRSGDALMFDSNRPHGFRSVGPGSARAVVTVVEKR
ncbi:MAG: cupin domain-containing protein [Nitrospirae bacterium]|nr:cupin domain-containing protein [Nitrospirota bacterium]